MSLGITSDNFHRLKWFKLPKSITCSAVKDPDLILFNLYFQVNVNGTLSQMAEAISGVPQGPILFVIYVNDLPDYLSADSLLYADDVKLIAPPKPP